MHGVCVNLCMFPIGRLIHRLGRTPREAHARPRRCWPDARLEDHSPAQSNPRGSDGPMPLGFWRHWPALDLPLRKRVGTRELLVRAWRWIRGLPRFAGRSWIVVVIDPALCHVTADVAIAARRMNTDIIPAPPGSTDKRQSVDARACGVHSFAGVPNATL
jgi:hypothetical protein